MTNGSKWWDKSWNPIIGCSPASPGCSNCYAARLAATRLAHLPAYAGLAAFDHGSGGQRVPGAHWSGEVRVNESALRAGPPSMRDGGTLFVCDMGDLFHDDAPKQWAAEVLSKLAALPASARPMLLTKRGEIMRERMLVHVAGREPTRLWCGVTCEDQPRHDERARSLRGTPAAWRFLSCEPLLGHIDLDLSSINWVIVGGESGPGARPCDMDDVESIVGQCQREGVPVFVKQLGSCPTHGTMPRRFKSRKGADMAEWPESLRVRQTPWGET